MRYYRMSARLLAPLAVQKNRQSDVSAALDYLPGSTLRGALAASYLKIVGGPEDRDFRRLFLEKPAMFPNLHPSGSKGETVARVLPLTAVSCKKNQGFKNSPADAGAARVKKSQAHGVFDNLAPKTAAAIAPKTEIKTNCPECGAKASPFTGYWDNDVAFPRLFEPTMLYHRHTGIDRDTGSVAHEMFFITQSMADYQKSGYDSSARSVYEPQYLAGKIGLSDDQAEILNRLLQYPVFAGSERTRGRGELEISLTLLESVGEMPDIESWSEAFKKQLELFSDGKIPERELECTYFSVDLDSDAILVDRFLRPATDLELPVENATLVLKIAKARTVRGWNSAWRMPKPDDLAVAAGSVFLFRYEGDEPEALFKCLDEIIRDGIGLRREEGFGNVAVCDKLHIISEVI